jgi:Mannosyltransferase (PIG-V)
VHNLYDAGAVNSLLLGWDGARRVAHAARGAHTLRERLGCVALAVGCALRCAVAVSPFLLLQLWAWLRFCAEGEGRPWCRSVPPFVYSFVQQEYWGLGPLSFWRREQAPNFALAAPVLLLTACGVVCAVRGARSRQSELEEAQRGARPRELLLAEQQVRTRLPFPDRC